MKQAQFFWLQESTSPEMEKVWVHKSSKRAFFISRQRQTKTTTTVTTTTTTTTKTTTTTSNARHSTYNFIINFLKLYSFSEQKPLSCFAIFSPFSLEHQTTTATTMMTTTTTKTTKMTLTMIVIVNSSIVCFCKEVFWDCREKYLTQATMISNCFYCA